MKIPKLVQNFVNFILSVFNVKLDAVFGLDISDGSVEILELKGFWKSRIAAYGRVMLEEGIVKDGEVLQREKLKQKIAEALASAAPRKVSTNKVVLSLPESKIFIHTFVIDIPKETRRKKRREMLTEVIWEEIGKVIPFNKENIYYDWDVTRVKGADGKMFNKVLFAAAPKVIVDEYIKTTSELGLEVSMLNPESINLGKILLGKNGKSTMIVDIGSRTSNISVFSEDGVLAISVAIPVAGSVFTQLIADKLNKSKEEAEKLKKEIGFQSASGAEKKKVMEILEPALKQIAREIKRAAEYYKKRHLRPISQIILVGGSALLPGLDSFFHKETKFEVDTANAFRHISWSLSLKKQPHKVLFANVAGLAAQGAANGKYSINLLKHIPRKKFKVVQTADLVALGHLRRVTIMRSILSNNSFFVVLVLIIAFIAIGVMLYCYVFFPLQQMSEMPSSAILEKTMPLVPIFRQNIKTPTSTFTSTSATTTVPEIIEHPMPMVQIQNTPTDWLNVRNGPGLNYNKITRVYPGESYTQLKEENGWYKIRISTSTEGWVSSQYVIIK